MNKGTKKKKGCKMAAAAAIQQQQLIVEPIMLLGNNEMISTSGQIVDPRDVSLLPINSEKNNSINNNKSNTYISSRQTRLQNDGTAVSGRDRKYLVESKRREQSSRLASTTVRRKQQTIDRMIVLSAFLTIAMWTILIFDTAPHRIAR